MITNRRFHTALALVATLAVTAPGVASAKPKVRGTKSPAVIGGVAFDGGFDQTQCSAIARYVNDQLVIIRNANPNTSSGTATIQTAEANIDRALTQGTDGGCFFGGIEWT